MMDTSYSVALRELMESLKNIQLRNSSSLSEASRTLEFSRRQFSELEKEQEPRFLEFKSKWRERLSRPVLEPFLERNRWYFETGGGFAMVGKGARRESKLLYLQSLHDMVVDAEKMMSATSGKIHRLQEQIVTRWHDESIRNESSKLLPALEASIRTLEFDVFKKIRLKTAELAQELFITKVTKWEKRIYPSKDALYRAAAWPWYLPGVNESGFEGFLNFSADYAEAFCYQITEYFETKWEIFLRGAKLTPDLEALGSARVSI